MGDSRLGRTTSVEFEIRELSPEELEKYIEFDSIIGWKFVDEEIRQRINFDDYREAHRKLIEDVYFSNLDNRLFAVMNGNKLVGIAWVGLKNG